MQEKSLSTEATTEKLSRHIWTTYKSRYNAHRRLLTLDKLQKFTLTTIAVYILAVSVLIINPDIIGSSKAILTNIYLVILSIISLALSLTMGQTEYKRKAMEFHKCARNLQRLYNYILMKKEVDSDYKLSNEEEDKYNNILDKFNLNHDKIDYEHFIFEKWKENKKNKFQVLSFHIKYFIQTKLIYILLILIPIGIGVYIIVK